MKNNNIWSVSALALTSLFIGCQSTPTSQSQFSLQGSINGYEGETIKIGYVLNDSTYADSVKITNGKFVFKGDLLDQPAVSGYVYLGDINDYRNRKACGLILEPTAMTLAIDTANFEKPQVTGSLSQAQSDSLNLIQESFSEEGWALRNALKEAKDEKQKEELEQKMETLSKKSQEAVLDFIRRHPQSYVAAQYLQYFMGRMTYDEIKSIYDNMSRSVKESEMCEPIVKELASLENVLPGKPAPYFRTLSHKGDSISLSDLKGKYVLLDFWATWCVPCRKSFPHVKALYEKYHDQGLEVFCVADNDSDPDNWKKVIESDGLQNFYHVLRGLKWDRSKGATGMDRTNDISDKFAVHYLPTKYLTDKDGNMIGKMGTDEQLDAKLKEIFGK